MRLTKLIVPFVAMSALAVPGAFAAITATVVPVATNPTDANGQTSSGFAAYIIRLTTDDGGNIGAIDTGGGFNSTNGIFGPLLQNWDIDRAGVVRTATPIESDTASPVGFYSLDSHFLVLTSAASYQFGPTEDNSLVNPPGGPSDIPGKNGSDYGTGTSMVATIAFTGVQSSSVDLAYVVVPTSGPVVTYSIDAGEAGDLLHTFHMAGVVPEPSTCGLLLVSSGIYLSRRRRPAAKP